jgi:hypothetical protein
MSHGYGRELAINPWTVVFSVPPNNSQPTTHNSLPLPEPGGN